MAPALLARVSLVLLLTAPVLGQDLDLSDALDDPKEAKPTPRKPSRGGNDFDLSDALDGDDPNPSRPRDQPKPDPKPRPPPGGDFSITDLEDAAGGKGRGGSRGGPEPEPEAGGSPQGLVPGIVGAVVAALAGAVSSFVAYQKRRLCFRESGPAPV
ncbi:CD99 antigen isoform X1 [Cricetulus griseus]|nr:CD99 antigen isoform X1 [Cricetulus griseus]